MGLNCHGERLPVEDIRALGFSWVRLDLPGNQYTLERLRSLVAYYRDFGQLWILPQTAPDPQETARVMADAGITEIEVFNEPDLNRISAPTYASVFKAIQAAVVGKVRLYGPSLCTWSSRRSYLDACLDRGVKPDVLTFHGYHQQTPQRLAQWVGEAKSYGLPVVVSELGYPYYLGDMAYRARMRDTLGDLFVKTRNALKGTPWCWYDGPNPSIRENSGIFQFDPKRGYSANGNFREIRDALARGGR